MTIVTTAIPRITDQFHSLDKWAGMVRYSSLRLLASSQSGANFTPFSQSNRVFWFVRLFLNLGVYYAVGSSEMLRLRNR